MFENISDKIKAFAKLICGLSVAGCVITGLIFLFDGNALLGIIIAAAGSLSSYVFAIIMYGLGALIENSETIIFQGEKIREEICELKKQKAAEKQAVQTETPAQEKPHKWMCVCGNMISDPICPFCGANYGPPDQKFQGL